MKMSEFSTFMDGDDCSDCKYLEREVIALKSKIVQQQAEIERLKAKVATLKSGKHDRLAEAKLTRGLMAAKKEIEDLQLRKGGGGR